MAEDCGLKYSMKLPLEKGVVETIEALIRFADDELDFYVERWKKREVERYRKGPLRWWRRNWTDQQVLDREIENGPYFWGYDWIKEYRVPYAVRPSTRELLQSILAQSNHYAETGASGYVYNDREIFDHIADGSAELKKNEKQ